MAVPKRKTSRASTHSRRSANRRLDEPARSLCPNCGTAKLPHVVCPTCGWYKGRQAVEVD
jgi:large subunit ribosomal protein L32